jgi:hypothetical protein
VAVGLIPPLPRRHGSFHQLKDDGGGANKQAAQDVDIERKKLWLQDLSLLWNGDQDRSALVLDEENDEPCRRGCAGIATNDVHVVWPFIEGLTRMEGD